MQHLGMNSGLQGMGEIWPVFARCPLDVGVWGRAKMQKNLRTEVCELFCVSLWGCIWHEVRRIGVCWCLEYNNKLVIVEFVSLATAVARHSSQMQLRYFETLNLWSNITAQTNQIYFYIQCDLHCQRMSLPLLSYMLLMMPVCHSVIYWIHGNIIVRLCIPPKHYGNWNAVTEQNTWPGWAAASFGFLMTLRFMVLFCLFV